MSLALGKVRQINEPPMVGGIMKTRVQVVDVVISVSMISYESCAWTLELVSNGYNTQNFSQLILTLDCVP